MGISSKNIVLILFLSVMIAGMGFRLLTEGMFMDGMMYAAISRNLAEGIGSLWNLHFSYTLFDRFFEHPPFHFLFQSLFYKIAGDHIFVEKIYSFITLLLTGFLLLKTYRLYHKEKTGTSVYLPLLLWILVPQVLWAYSNNMLENTMGVFTTLSIFLMALSKKQHKPVFFILAGMILMIAFYTKGLTGLFPLAFPFIYWIIMEIKKPLPCLRDAFFLISAFVISTWAVFHFWPGAADHMTSYFNKQVMGNVKQSLSWSNLNYVKGFLIENSIAFVLLISVTIIAFQQLKKGGRALLPVSREALLFILLALSGVLPICLSSKRSMYYALCAFPVFSIGLALLAVPVFKVLDEILDSSILTRQILSVVTMLLLFFSIGYTVVNSFEPHRDKGLISDLKTLKKIIPQYSIVTIPSSLYSDWSFHAMCERYGRWSLDPSGIMHENAISKIKNDKKIADNYLKLDIHLENLILYRSR